MSLEELALAARKRAEFVRNISALPPEQQKKERAKIQRELEYANILNKEGKLASWMTR